MATVQCIGNIAASAVAGILWTAVSPAAAFGYLVACTALALAGLLFTARSGFAPPAVAVGTGRVRDRLPTAAAQWSSSCPGP